MKKILLIGGGIQQVPAVKRLQEYGYHVVVSDRDKDCACSEIADQLINLDANSLHDNYWEYVDTAPLDWVDGVFTLSNLAGSVSLVASKLGLPHIPYDIVKNVDNKITQKQMLVDAGIPTPKHTVCDGYVIKEPDNFGGRGIQVCDETAIIEQKVDGHFIDTQIFINGDSYIGAGNCSSFFINKPHPIEVLNISPAQVGQDVIDEAYELTYRAALACGIDWGPVAGDLVLTNDGLMVVELTPRLHGPNGSLWCMTACGINPLRFLAQTVCGEKRDIGLLVPKNDRIGIAKVFLEPTQVKRSEHIVNVNHYPPHPKYTTARTAVFLGVPDILTGMLELERIRDET